MPPMTLHSAPADQHSRELLERLHRAAYYDPLLQLPNRALFIEKVDACVQRQAQDHVLALVDIDDFSATNDLMGHRFGDRLLGAVAPACCRTCAPPSKGPSCSWSTSRRSTWAMARWWVWKRCCAGVPGTARWCRPTSSSPWRNIPG